MYWDSMRQAFVQSSSLVVQRRSLIHEGRKCRRRSGRSIQACTSSETAAKSSADNNSNTGDNILHDSWRIYSKPGNLCVICFGKGYSQCLFCYGKGTVRIGPEEKRDTVSCPQCGGTKQEYCRRCKGSGIRPSFRYVSGSAEPVRNLTNEEVCNLPTQAEVEAEAEAAEQAQKHELNHVKDGNAVDSD